MVRNKAPSVCRHIGRTTYMHFGAPHPLDAAKWCAGSARRSTAAATTTYALESGYRETWGRSEAVVRAVLVLEMMRYPSPVNSTRPARSAEEVRLDREVARAEGCLRAFLAWVGAPPTDRKNTAVAKVVNEILDNDPAVVYAAMRRLALASAPTDLLTARYQLTRREADVARLLAVGKSNAEVAEALSISEHTARRHTEQVLLKLGVRSRAAVAPLLAEVAAEAPAAAR